MGHRLYYNKPAEVWEEAMPLGNGSLGAMVYGGAEAERIMLNLDTLWSGQVNDPQKTDRTEALKRVREAIDREDYAEATRLADKYLTNDCAQAFLPLGELKLDQIADGFVKNYSRILDMERGYCEIAFQRAPMSVWRATNVHRRCYVSHPHGVMVYEIDQDIKSIFTICFNPSLETTVLYGEDEITVRGRAPSQSLWRMWKKNNVAITSSMERLTQDDRYPVAYDDQAKTVGYAVKIKVIHDGVSRRVDHAFTICEATKLRLIVAAETDFTAYNKAPNSEKPLEDICSSRISRAIADGPEAVFEEHVRDHGALYCRMELKIGDKCSDDNRVTVDSLLEGLKRGESSLELIETLFHFGRYLMISASRKGTQPMNAQGMWSNSVKPAWGSIYTVNINAQMNYWPAEVCNLSELHMPLIEMIRDISEAGEATARDFYGARGFCAHHNVDLWRKTSPSQGYSRYAIWPMAGGWLCRHLWEHYEYTQDEEFLLHTALPIIEKSVRFYLDFMVCDNGVWMTSPSTSPENEFITDGKRASVTKGTAMDKSILKELFSYYIKTCDRLGIENDILRSAKEVAPKLAPLEIDSRGRIMEWNREFEETQPDHRHLSHLYGLFPGDSITEDTPALLEAARKSIAFRLEPERTLQESALGEDASGWGVADRCGWSCIWITCFFARMKDAALAERYLLRFMGNSIPTSLLNIYPNFQIDGNTAFSAAVAELLLQSHRGIIELLPAKPEGWRTGSVKGICARGGYTVDMEWDDNTVNATLYAKRSGTCRVSAFGQTRELSVKANGCCSVSFSK